MARSQSAIRVAALLLASSGVGAFGCGGEEKQVKVNRWGRPIPEGAAAKVPAWVSKLPTSGGGKVYAVGRSGPTYWPQDGINNSSDDARGKLALSLSSHVENLGENVETNRRQGNVDVSKEATDLVMQNSRIDAIWVDESGAQDEPGSVWALAAIDVDAAKGKGDARLSSSGPALGSDGKPLKNPAPAWLDRLPSSSGRVYAVGYSGPTFRPEDAQGYAGDAATDNLATSLRSHVQAYNLLVETSTGLSVDDFAHTEDPDQAFKDLVKKGAKVEQVWVDKEGVRPGDPPGAVWALTSIDVSSTKGGYNTVQNDDLGPALDKQGNAVVDDAKTAGTGGASASNNAAAAAKAQSAANGAAARAQTAENAAAAKATNEANTTAGKAAAAESTAAGKAAIPAATVIPASTMPASAK